MTTRKSFTYGNDRVDYEVAFVPTKKSKVSIHVHADCSVRVDAPEGRDLPEIHQAVLKRAGWIKHHLDEFKRQRAQALPRTYTSGESLFYLGKRYQLKVKSLSGPASSVKLIRGQICVETGSRDASIIKECLATWYRNRASEMFARRFDEIADQVAWLRQPPKWRLVRMQKQWGSCSPAGHILLNPHLIKAPRECIDYVISHELCHLKEHNHSPRYYRLLGKIMPSWEPVKARLDGMAELLLNE
jgi:predicted metal-dependent hydrolase